MTHICMVHSLFFNLAIVPLPTPMALCNKQPKNYEFQQIGTTSTTISFKTSSIGRSHTGWGGYEIHSKFSNLQHQSHLRYGNIEGTKMVIWHVKCSTNCPFMNNLNSLTILIKFRLGNYQYSPMIQKPCSLDGRAADCRIGAPGFESLLWILCNMLQMYVC